MDGSTLFTASGRRIYRLVVEGIDQGREKVEGKEDDEEWTGGEDYLPVERGDHILASLSRVRERPEHVLEVQTVVVDRWRLASIDAGGRTIVGVFGGKGEMLRNNGNGPGMDTFRIAYVLNPDGATTGEPGWAGLSLHPSRESSTVTARFFYRTATLYDADMAVRSFRTLACPSAISYINDGDEVFALAEGRFVSVWDPRVAENGGCVLRKAWGGTGKLYCISVLPSSGLIATAGSERTVQVADIRTQAIRHRWTSCLKYECVWLSLSESDPGTCHVVGMDNEFACGVYDPTTMNTSRLSPQKVTPMLSGALARSPARLFGFRADDRWIGLVSKDRFTLGLSERKTLYVLEG